LHNKDFFFFRNERNPRFTTRVQLKYFFERTQNLKFVVYDVDGTSGNLANFDVIGEVVIIIDQFILLCIFFTICKKKKKRKLQ